MKKELEESNRKTATLFDSQNTYIRKKTTQVQFAAEPTLDHTDSGGRRQAEYRKREPIPNSTLQEDAAFVDDEDDGQISQKSYDSESDIDLTIIEQNDNNA